MKREYLDASAFIKLILPEPESHALREWLRGRTWVSSILLRAEALRAASRHGTPAVDAAMRMLRRTEFIRLGRALLDHSAVVGAPDVRTLDAIHLTAAASLGASLGAVVTYDERLGEVARSLRMRVVSPRCAAAS